MDGSVFVGFEQHDYSRALVVHKELEAQGKRATGFIDTTSFANMKLYGDIKAKKWIDRQLMTTVVTTILVGQYTDTCPWVIYTIEKSIALGKGLLGIDISKIKNLDGKIDNCCDRIPKGYPFYLWNKDYGDCYLIDWIVKALPSLKKENLKDV